MTLTAPWPHTPIPTVDEVLAVAVDRLTAELRALREDLQLLRAASQPTPAPPPPTPAGPTPGAELDFGRVVIDPAAHQVHIDGQPRPFTAREWGTLSYLAHRPGQVVTHTELQLAVWGTPYTSRNTITEHIRRVRVRLHPLTPIVTVRGVGYRWDWQPTRLALDTHTAGVAG